MSKETYYMTKRDLLYGKRALFLLAYPRYVQVSKETYSYGKRGVLSKQKRPTITGIPEVRTSVKRDLFIWKKRPIHMAKKTYCTHKRDLQIHKHT